VWFAGPGVAGPRRARVVALAVLAFLLMLSEGAGKR